MDVRNIFFYIFAAVLLFAAVRVITARNPVHAVLYLILAFSQAAGVWLLMRAEFLAILLVMVYLGAVMVLFLFVVMMLDIRIERLQGALKRNLPLALIIFAFIVLEMILVLYQGFPTTEALGEGVASSPDYNNTLEIGRLMYTEYLLPVEIAGLILLVGMLAAIALTLRKRKDNKAIDASTQIHVKPAQRLRVIQMDSVRLTPEPAPENDAAQTEQDKAKPTQEGKK